MSVAACPLVSMQAAGSGSGEGLQGSLSVDATNLVGAIVLHNQSVKAAHAAQVG